MSSPLASRSTANSKRFDTVANRRATWRAGSDNCANRAATTSRTLSGTASPAGPSMPASSHTKNGLPPVRSATIFALAPRPSDAAGDDDGGPDNGSPAATEFRSSRTPSTSRPASLMRSADSTRRRSASSEASGSVTSSSASRNVPITNNRSTGAVRARYRSITSVCWPAQCRSSSTSTTGANAAAAATTARIAERSRWRSTSGSNSAGRGNPGTTRSSCGTSVARCPSSLCRSANASGGRWRTSCSATITHG